MICTSLGSLSVASVIWDSAAWSYTWRRLHACPAIWGLHFCLYLLEHRLGEVLDSTEVDNIDSPAEVAGDLTSAYSRWKVALMESETLTFLRYPSDWISTHSRAWFKIIFLIESSEFTACFFNFVILSLSLSFVHLGFLLNIFPEHLHFYLSHIIVPYLPYFFSFSFFLN